MAYISKIESFEGIKGLEEQKGILGASFKVKVETGMSGFLHDGGIQILSQKEVEDARKSNDFKGKGQRFLREAIKHFDFGLTQ